MSRSATDFAQSWVSENINAEAYDPPRAYVESYVERLKADAAADGVSEEELVEGVGDLFDYVSDAMEAATDNEVERLASKDD